MKQVELDLGDQYKSSKKITAENHNGRYLVRVMELYLSEEEAKKEGRQVDESKWITEKSAAGLFFCTRESFFYHTMFYEIYDKQEVDGNPLPCSNPEEIKDLLKQLGYQKDGVSYLREFRSENYGESDAYVCRGLTPEEIKTLDALLLE
ncbi:hypothetical protein GOV03_02380 [Candidatus Woesearchaeota archaeon]|nr:hypothetical protein [Candidatus Woesearchaeota archaeon]